LKEKVSGAGPACIPGRIAPGLAVLLFVLGLGITCLVPSASAAGADPDVSILPSDVTLSFYTPTEGDTVSIYVQLGVNYTGEETGVVVEVLLDGSVEFLAEAMIGPDRTSAMVSFDWAAKNGIHTITVVLDPHEDFPETDEHNNTASETVTVKRLPPSPSQFDWAQYVCGAFIVICLILVGALIYASWKKGGGESKKSEPDAEKHPPDEVTAEHSNPKTKSASKEKG